VWKILRAAGINPTRDRTGTTWSEFIRSQANAIIATDFACVDTELLRRFHVLFAVEIATRRVHLAAITANPTGTWTTQKACNLLMRLPVHHGFRFLIRDGAGQFTAAFEAVLSSAGIEAIPTTIDHTENSTNEHPTTTQMSSRSAQDSRSSDTPPATGSSTNTNPPYEPPKPPHKSSRHVQAWLGE